LEEPIQLLIESFGIIKDSEGKPSDPLGPPISVDRIHLSINLSLKLLWCMYILYSGHQHTDAKEKIY
jgi:hypothetical protein